MAESLVQTGTLETPQMLFLPVSHVAIGRIEALQSVLVAPIYWAAVHFPRVGNVQTAPSGSSPMSGRLPRPQIGSGVA